MPYVKIDDKIFQHPKILAVGSGAKLVYLAGICYSGMSLTDGFIPAHQANVLAVTAGLSSSAKYAKELVAAGLWVEIEGGYQVHDYLDYNESAAKVHTKKEAARDRMAEMRAGKKRGSSSDVRANNERSSQNVRSTTTSTTTETSFPDGKENTPKPPKRKSGELSEVQQSRFDRWYKVFPRKVSKADAIKAWANIDPPPTNDLTDQMVAKVEEWAASESWSDVNFVPYPATWLNAERWTDGPPPPPRIQPTNMTRVSAPAPRHTNASGDDNMTNAELEDFAATGIMPERFRRSA
jgi:hypothetical protein